LIGRITRDGTQIGDQGRIETLFEEKASNPRLFMLRVSPRSSRVLAKDNRKANSHELLDKTIVDVGYKDS
jgi:hypothetical protein